MRGYLSVRGGDNQIPLEERVEVYRTPDDSGRIVLDTTDQTVRLDVADMTVSRKTGDEAPVVLEPRSEHIEIHNQGNTNGVTVIRGEREVTLDAGFLERVSRDVRVKIGYQTVLQLDVEREARQEYVIEGNVEQGDVVMGSAEKVDRSTTVTDSVVNRSDLGAGDHSDEGERTGTSPTGGASQASDATPGPADGPATTEASKATQKFCETHQRSYADTCPECAAEPNDDDTTETKYCVHCGSSVPAAVRTCPDCEGDLSEF